MSRYDEYSDEFTNPALVLSDAKRKLELMGFGDSTDCTMLDMLANLANYVSKTRDIQTIKATELSENAIVIVKSKYPLPMAACERIKDTLLKIFKGHKVIVLEEGLDLQFVEPKDSRQDDLPYLPKDPHCMEEDKS